MKFRVNTVFLLSLLFKGVEPGRVLKADKQELVIEGEYIVVLKNQNSSGSSAKGKQNSFAVSDAGDSVSGYVSSVSSSILSQSNVSNKISVLSSYSKSLAGFALSGANSKDASIIAQNDNVDYVEQNQKVYVDDFGRRDLQGSVTWGIDRVDQRDLPLDQKYEPPSNGSNVKAYILDTGVQISHDEFGDRARWGANTSGDGDDRDCHGHGTHVAGTVGGTEYGVAKNVEIIAVKVLTCSGSGSTAGVIAGVDWVRQQAAEDSENVSTANMSLGGGFSSALNTAVKNLHESGVPTVVAAGNDNGNACTKSPASEPAVITVGSTTNNDSRSSFSNFGECLDIFAPGSGITAAWIGNDSATNTISGTSMASPHVCGGVALLLEAGIPAADIVEELVSRATSNKVTDEKTGSPNKLLYVGAIGPTNEPTPAPPTDAPTPCNQGTVEVKIMTDNYPAETSWTLEETASEENVGSGGGYSSANTEYVAEICVADVEHTFTISDTYGDGMCCSYGTGSYTVNYNGIEVASGAQYGLEETKKFSGTTQSDAPEAAPSNTPEAAPSNTPVASPSNAPVAPPTNAPVAPPTNAPVAPPTNAPVAPPTNAPVAPPTDAPVAPLTDAPVAPPTDAPVAPLTDAPVAPLTDAPVAPLTEAPVAPLTDAPVVPPTDAPVVPPTDAPVVPPTSPIATPTDVDCTNEDADQFFSRKKNGQILLKTCGWLSGKNPNKIKSICTNKVKYAEKDGDIYGPAQVVCPEICDSCGCYENQKTKIFFLNPSGVRKEKRCDQVANNPNKFCEPVDESDEKGYPSAVDGCPVTCGSCSA